MPERALQQFVRAVAGFTAFVAYRGFHSRAVVSVVALPFFSESSFNDGTTQNGTRPPIQGSHHLKSLVYGGLGLGLTLSEKAEGLEGSEWLLVGIGATIIIELRVSV